ncbi:MAG: DUF4363 family protein [Clostridia bacterium]|nr:DUF4363 family protein [Clostridia bacterium]
MVKTAISILVALGIIVGVSYLEVWQVNRAFSIFREALVALYKKTESEQATHEDGKSVRMLWEKEKRTLYFWLSHTVIENIDYQLNESLGYLYEGGYQDALPKLEILIKMSEYIPDSYTLDWENII